MKDQLDYVFSWGVLVIVAILFVICLIWGCSAINVEYCIWAQRHIAKANIERAKGLAEVNKILGYKVKFN